MGRQKHVWDSRVVFRVAELFIKGDDSVKEIVEKVNRELRPKRALSREAVYWIMREAAKSYDIIRLVPPPEEKLQTEIEKRFNLDPDSVRVVYTNSKDSNHLVAQAAAEVALERIVSIFQRKNGAAVGLGLGPGRGTLDFCQHFRALIDKAVTVPRVTAFAIAAGCPVNHPEYAPPSFFNLLPNRLFATAVKSAFEPWDAAAECQGTARVGLFAEPMVTFDDFQALKREPGPFKIAYDRREEIDVVINCMGDAKDDHDLYQLFHSDYGLAVPKGYFANVQYRPFRSDGTPIVEKGKVRRPVTLFELEDFGEMFVERKNKSVILIARQCGACGKTRAGALRPLLTSPQHRLWTDLIMDVATADEVLRS